MPFTTKLLTISPWLALLLINTIFVGFSLILLSIIRFFVSYQALKGHNDVVSGIFNRAGAMYGVMLAFTVVILWQQYHVIYDNALKEGNVASELHRDLTLYPDKSQTEPAVIALMNFVKSVVHDEYPAMAQMKDSQKTEQAMNILWLNIVRIQPKSPQEQALYNKILRDIENLSVLRNTRLLDIDASLPDMFWVAIIIGAIIAISYSVLLGAEKLWLHALLTSMLAIIIATTIFLILELDYPFIGELSAKPLSYIKILEVNNSSFAPLKGGEVIESIGDSVEISPKLGAWITKLGQGVEHGGKEIDQVLPEPLQEGELAGLFFQLAE